MLIVTEAKAQGWRALAAIADAPRHTDTSAYGAYLMYAKAVRFGQDGPNEAAGAAILDPIAADTTSDTLVLARAARDATSGQLARAKQSVGPLAARDVDVVSDSAGINSMTAAVARM